jgi:hypothetical protein
MGNQLLSNKLSRILPSAIAMLMRSHFLLVIRSNVLLQHFKTS